MDLQGQAYEMSKPTVQITATYADGKTLDEFKRVLDARRKYLNETAFQSIHAMAVETLKSVRSLTKVAKPSGIKVDLTPRTDLKFSYYHVTAATTGSKSGVRMCIRGASGMRFEDNQIGKFVFVDLKGAKLASVQVYQFKDVTGDNKVYLICATSQSKAKKAAQNIVARRLLRYAGLAKRAVSALMIKTNNKGPADAVSARVYQKANEVTTVKNQIVKNPNGSGVYSLTAMDDLRYAGRALKGGQASVDMALRKAANKSVGLIQHKCKNVLLPGELKTPFPEITKKGAA